MTKDHFETCFSELYKVISVDASLNGFEAEEKSGNEISVLNNNGEIIILKFGLTDSGYALKADLPLPLTGSEFHTYILFFRGTLEVESDRKFIYNVGRDGQNINMNIDFYFDSFEDLLSELHRIMKELFYDRISIASVFSKEIKKIDEMYCN